ncbi:MAG TPA: M20/M25/M40 family metallo-hydrolase, partial [Roseiflexaceae bacterium]|nr:M20/M25/M40 family metallo-hydrolase [Roseiflexaceae bacterium]
IEQRITTWVEQRLSTYIDELTQLCAIECPTSSKAGVDAAGAWVREWATRHGLEVTSWPQTLVGDSVMVSLRGNGKTHVLLAAHLDTVYEVGTAAARPVRQEGNKLLGPGTADNKSGLLSGLYSLLVLRELGMLDTIGVASVFCGGDEETTMDSFVTIMNDLAPQYHVALVLEAGRENGDIVRARKGGGGFVLETHGRAAHAGVEPEKGAHAILAMAHYIVALQALNGLRPGVTVNVGVVEGGSVPNAVPDHARALIDARVVQPEDVEVVTAAIKAACSQQVVPGVRSSLQGSFRFGPMATTPSIAALAGLAAQIAVELGFTVGAAATGGISYANHLATLGLPVVDGLGPVGGLDHSPQEYIDQTTIVPRTAMLSALVARCSEVIGISPRDFA